MGTKRWVMSNIRKLIKFGMVPSMNNTEKTCLMEKEKKFHIAVIVI